MQMLVCFFILFSVSFANYYDYDGDVHVYNNLYSFLDSNNRGLGPVEQLPRFDFEYRSGQLLKINIFLKNKPEYVSVQAFLNYSKGLYFTGTPTKCIQGCATKGTPENYTRTKEMKEIWNKKKGYGFEIKHHLESRYIRIGLVLSTNSGFCTSKEIVEAKIQTIKNDETYNDICLKDDPCVVEVDLSRSECKVPEKSTATPLTTDHYLPEVDTNNITGNDNNNVEEFYKQTKTTEQHSESNVLMYVIPPVVVTCVITLVVYIIFKKYRLQNSHPGRAREFNTYATGNEVVYADLGLAPGNNRIPIREETPYARIIGVMKPVT